MVIGTARIVLGIWGNDSLKGKRKVVRRVIDRVRHRFNVAVAEVADMDEHRRAVLGFAVVSNSERHATSMIDTIIAQVRLSTDAPIMEQRMEILHVGKGLEEDWDLDAEEALLEGEESARR
ncbi:MAG: DUF503 family protein [Polyangiales bacterium]|nr:DUF503 family protein [Myxococcales bacterium]